MIIRPLHRPVGTALAAAALSLAPFAATTAVAQTTPQVIATGLDNPRGLAFGPNGFLFVAEAGRGGTGTLCLPDPEGGADRCYGATGAITQISGIGVQQRVLTGLPSVAGPTGAGATGPHDIEFAFGSAWVTVGFGGDPATRAPFEQAGIKLDTLYNISFSGQVTPVVDIGAFEVANNPDGGLVDSNAYGFKILSDRGVVADAGANALLQIDLNGTVSTLATFPTRMVPNPFAPGDVPMQAVPTSVVEGPDGSLYVGELTGFPFPVDGARVYRVPAAGGDPVVVAEGFTNIIDIAIGADGSAYVLEHDVNGLLAEGTMGRLTKIGIFGSRTEIAAGQLDDPGAMAIGTDNALYVTTHSTSAGGGQVVRIVQ